MVGWDHTTPDVVRVLHVDDDESVLDLTTRFLEQIDDSVEITTAVGVDAGFAALEENTFDCIVCDYKMPSMNGVEFLEAVRETHPDVPFVLFTGEGSESVASEAIAAGATDYVPKGGGSDRYEVLANRINNAVESYRTEQALRETAERFQRLAEAAPVPIGVIDADGVLQYLNEAGAGFFEVEDAESVVGRVAFDLVHPEDRERASRRVRRVVEHQETPETLETRFVTPDGSLKYGQVSSAPIEFHGDPAAQVVLNDVTAERRAEGELVQQEALTGSLLDALDGVFFVFDEDDGLVRWNDRVETVTGYDADELEGMPSTAFAPQGYDGITTESVIATEEDERRRYDGVIETKYGEHIPYEFTETRYETESGTYRVGIGQDISRRVEREGQLRMEKEQLETIVENFPVVLFVIDAEGTFLRSTGAGLSKLGIAPGEVEGKSIYEVYGEHEDIIATFERALSGETLNSTVAVNGRTFESFYEPVESPEGVTEVVGASFDVTERVEQRASLEAKNARLEQFASVVSHDLRNPLGVARGAFEMVAEYVEGTPPDVAEGEQPDSASVPDERSGRDSQPDEEASRRSAVNATGGVPREMALDQLPRVRSAHERMDRIIDDVLALARGGTDVEERPVNVGNVASEAAGTVETTDANVDVACDRVVLADRSSLKRLLENLLRNAAEHGGSQIRVGELPADGDATAAADADATAGDATAAADADATAGDATAAADADGSAGDATAAADADATAGDATAAADGDGTAGDATSAPGGFYVADDGPGIDESERASVLDAGVSMEDGTGLGLAIVRDIADAHGWCVSVETDPELGGARIAVRDVERA